MTTIKKEIRETYKGRRWGEKKGKCDWGVWWRQYCSVTYGWWMRLNLFTSLSVRFCESIAQISYKHMVTSWVKIKVCRVLKWLWSLTAGGDNTRVSPSLNTCMSMYEGCNTDACTVMHHLLVNRRWQHLTKGHFISTVCFSNVSLVLFLNQRGRESNLLVHTVHGMGAEGSDMVTNIT